MEKNLDITKPRNSKQIVPVPWPLVDFSLSNPVLIDLRTLNSPFSIKQKKKRKEENIKSINATLIIDVKQIQTHLQHTIQVLHT